MASAVNMISLCLKVSVQPGSQRCPVPAIRYSRGDVLPRVSGSVLACVRSVDVSGPAQREPVNRVRSGTKQH